MLGGQQRRVNFDTHLRPHVGLPFLLVTQRVQMLDDLLTSLHKPGALITLESGRRQPHHLELLFPFLGLFLGGQVTLELHNLRELESLVRHLSLNGRRLQLRRRRRHAVVLAALVEVGRQV